jgi:hypothetical protein
MVEAIKSELNSEGIDCASYAFDTSVVIVHDNDNEHDCPLLCKAIEEALPDWDAIEEEWQEENPEEDEYEAHGFRDEADYLNWKYG